MGFLRLEQIEADENKVLFHFSASDDVRKFLKQNTFYVEYSEGIASVPRSILAVPFVANFLPSAWLCDVDLQVDELDETFYRCIPEIEAGYHFMYPQWKMGGKVSAGKLVRTEWEPERVGSLFSGGLDALHTMFRHLEEKPDLVTIWGGDVIGSDNEAGWRIMKEKIVAVSSRLHLKNIFLRSDFQKVDAVELLEKIAVPVLHDSWWHGIKHSVPLLGMVMPIAYLKKYAHLYIASSHWAKDPVSVCASNPWSDSKFRAGSCDVVHDGFECNRQEKARDVIDACRKIQFKVPIRVCWSSDTGENCCRCEKCYRTITELLLEGANPEEYGFRKFRALYTRKRVSKKMRRVFYEQNRCGQRNTSLPWNIIKKRLIERRSEFEKSEFWPVFDWLIRHDYTSKKDITLPFDARIKGWLKQLRHFFGGR